MKGKRNTIRQFIESVEWATPSNISYLLEGRYDTRLYRRYEKELIEMTKTKHPAPLIRLKNQDGKTVFAYKTSKKDIGTQHFNHNVKLRNCLGRFMFDNEMQEVSLKGTSDAKIGNLCFELDNGHMSQEQLSDKLKDHYRGKGNFRVIFIMSHRYNPDCEKGRLQMLFEIVKDVLKFKPNRVLGACYSQYLIDGKVFNLRGEEIRV